MFSVIQAGYFEWIFLLVDAIWRQFIYVSGGYKLIYQAITEIDKRFDKK